MPSGQAKIKASEKFWSRRDSKLRRLYASGQRPPAIARAIFGQDYKISSPITVRNRLVKLGLYQYPGRGVRYQLTKKQAQTCLERLQLGESAKDVAASLNVSRDTLRNHLRGHFPGFDGKTLISFWTPAKLKELHRYYFDEDHTVQECIDYFGNTSIQHIFKMRGWRFRSGAEANRVRYARRFRETGRKREAWLIYFNRIRHCSNVMYARFASIIDPQGLRSRAHHLDHEFPIARMFDENPDLWYLVAHPANLRILTAQCNLSKRHHAHMSIARLYRRVRQWNRRYGKINLQEFFGVRDIFDCHLPATWWKR